ncbi:MAG: ABC transporter permease subunit [Promethearchaeia archaeon]
MDFEKIFLIMKKDFKLNLRNKQISVPIFILPILFSIIIPIFMFMGILSTPTSFVEAFGNSSELRRVFNIPKSYNNYIFAASVMARLFLLPYFLLIPSFLTVILASGSFAEEKDKRTMESLVLLPISKNELIMGKLFSSFIPTIFLSIIFFCIQGFVANIMFFPYLEGNILIFGDIIWILSMILLMPSLSFFNTIISTMISSRVKDLKSAQSISGFLTTPSFIFLFGSLLNPAFLSFLSIIIISIILLIGDYLLFKLATKVLDIEKLILLS